MLRCIASALTELKRYNTALEVAGRFAYDDVIDPADTRAILLNTLATLPAPLPRATRKRMIEPYLRGHESLPFAYGGGAACDHGDGWRPWRQFVAIMTPPRDDWGTSLRRDSATADEVLGVARLMDRSSSGPSKPFVVSSRIGP